MRRVLRLAMVVAIGLAGVMGSSCTAPATQRIEPVVRSHEQVVTLSYASRIAKPVFTLSASKPAPSDAKSSGPFEETIVTVPPPPKDIRKVDAMVQSVRLPFINTGSIVGERATVIFSVKTGDVPAYPECSQIRLTFDSYVNPFSKGQHFTFQFLPNGDFWGIEELPSN